MCELFGMSSNIPTDVCFNLTELMRRGGGTGPHKDGWGIAFYEGNAARILKETLPSSNSKFATFVQSHPIHSQIVISHIRRANRGKVCLENTHPFSRELWGRQWTFAHNGQIAFVKNRPLLFSKPVGTTDSEHAFCWMIDKIREEFPSPPKRIQTLIKFIHTLCDDLAADGVFNMLLSDAQYLYAYCSTRLSVLKRSSMSGDSSFSDDEMSVEVEKNSLITVVATVPLTKESWKKLDRGQLIVLKDGEVYDEKLKPLALD